MSSAGEQLNDVAGGEKVNVFKGKLFYAMVQAMRQDLGIEDP